MECYSEPESGRARARFRGLRQFSTFLWPRLLPLYLHPKLSSLLPSGRSVTQCHCRKAPPQSRSYIESRTPPCWFPEGYLCGAPGWKLRRLAAATIPLRGRHASTIRSPGKVVKVLEGCEFVSL